MKKIILAILFLTLTFVSINQVYAYEDFQWFEKVGNFKLLNEFSDTDYTNYYKKVKRKAFDWNIYEVTSKQKINFESETLFKYYNDGFSPIKYEYKAQNETYDTVSLNVSGGIKLATKKNSKIFGDGLNAHIEAKFTIEKKNVSKETFDIKVDIMPGTQLVLSMVGEGRLSNGVAKKYFFWHEVNKGGFEIFRVTSHFSKLEVTQI